MLACTWGPQGCRWRSESFVSAPESALRGGIVGRVSFTRSRSFRQTLSAQVCSVCTASSSFRDTQFRRVVSSSDHTARTEIPSEKFPS